MAHMTDNKPALGHPLFHLADALVGLKQRSRGRRETQKLLSLNDHMLRDMGVTRDQVHDALQAPASQDASEALQRLALQKRGPWM